MDRAKLTDAAIRAWIRDSDGFEGRTDGGGLVLTWRPDRTTPHWRLRHRFAGKSRVMNLGGYTGLNHTLKGVEGVNNRHDHFEERRRALEALGQLLLTLERGEVTAKTGKAKAA